MLTVTVLIVMVLAVIALTGTVLTCSCVSNQRCLKKNNTVLLLSFCAKVLKNKFCCCVCIRRCLKKNTVLLFSFYSHTHTHKQNTPLKKHLCVLTKEKHPILLFSIKNNNTTLMRGVYRGHQPKVHGGLKMYEMC